LYFNRLKQKWNITSNFQLVVIFIVFGITGSMSVRIAKPLLDILNIYPEAFESIWGGNFLYWIIRILIVFPAYQVLLLFFGAVFFSISLFLEF